MSFVWVSTLLFYFLFYFILSYFLLPCFTLLVIFPLGFLCFISSCVCCFSLGVLEVILGYAVAVTPASLSLNLLGSARTHALVIVTIHLSHLISSGNVQWTNSNS